MRNRRRNKMIIVAMWLIVLAFGTGLFVSAQTLAQKPPSQEEKLASAQKTFDEAMTLFQHGTANHCGQRCKDSKRQTNCSVKPIRKRGKRNRLLGRDSLPIVGR